MAEDLRGRNGIRDGVTTVGLHSIENHLCLLRGEELVLVGEVGDEEICNDTQSDCNDTLDEEDPLPPTETAPWRDLSEAVRHDSAEASEEDGD